MELLDCVPFAWPIEIYVPILTKIGMRNLFRQNLLFGTVRRNWMRYLSVLNKQCYYFPSLYLLDALVKFLFPFRNLVPNMGQIINYVRFQDFTRCIFFISWDGTKLFVRLLVYLRFNRIKIYLITWVLTSY